MQFGLYIRLRYALRVVRQIATLTYSGSPGLPREKGDDLELR